VLTVRRVGSQDYTLDDARYGSNWTLASPIFSAGMFGSYAASARDAGHAIADGVFAHLPIASNGAMNRTDWPERNAFGRLTESWNQDPSAYVGRTSTICGLETRARLPGCSELRKLVASANLTNVPGAFLSAFEGAVEEGFHAELHGMIGGAWDCTMRDGTSLDMAAMARRFPEAREILETVGIYLNLLWRSVYQHDLNCASCKYAVTCPTQGACESHLRLNASADAGAGTHASPTLTYEDCRCASTLFDSAYDEVKDDQHALTRLVDDALRSDGINSAIVNAEFKTQLWRNVSGTITFIGSDGVPLAAPVNAELKVFLAKLILHPAKVSSFATPLAATNDPLFWASHSNWERVWHFVQLKPSVQYAKSVSANTNRTAESLKLYWDVVHPNPTEMNICWGRYWQAELPFSDFLDEGTGHYYTNGELLQLFQPENPELPFLYDDDAFRWDHCEGSHAV
jgi:hypothetical protein